MLWNIKLGWARIDVRIVSSDVERPDWRRSVIQVTMDHWIVRCARGSKLWLRLDMNAWASFLGLSRFHYHVFGNAHPRYGQLVQKIRSRIEKKWGSIHLLLLSPHNLVKFWNTVRLPSFLRINLDQIALKGMSNNDTRKVRFNFNRRMHWESSFGSLCWRINASKHCRDDRSNRRILLHSTVKLSILIFLDDW